MKKIISFVIICVFCLTTYVQADAINSHSELDRVTVFNQMSDYVMTIGQSESTKKQTIRKRKVTRRKRRLKKQREKKQAEYKRLIRNKKRSFWPWKNN